VSEIKKIESATLLKIVIFAVAINGIAYIIDPFLNLFHVHIHNLYHLNASSLSVDVVIGLTLIYLSSLLARRKSNAFILAMSAYGLVVIINLFMILSHSRSNNPRYLAAVYRNLRTVCIPQGIYR
jgi:hypothetical protein